MLKSLSYSSDALVAGGNFSLTSFASVMLDNLVVTDFNPDAEVVEALATPAPMPTLSEDGATKLSTSISLVVDAFVNGNSFSNEELSSLYLLDADEEGRIFLKVKASDGITGDSLVALVQNAGGVVTRVEPTFVTAYIPLNGVIELANATEVDDINKPIDAAPTGPVGANETLGFDILGAQDWHLAGVTGQGVKIGVIDSGFNGTFQTGAQDKIINV